MKDVDNLIRRMRTVEQQIQHHTTHNAPATVGQVNASGLELVKMMRELAEAVQELQKQAKRG